MFYSKQTCSHETCKKIRKERNSSKIGGVAVAYIVNYKLTGNYALLLGKERGGSYKDTYNLCAGAVEDKDGGCYIKAAIRESREEFKLDISNKGIFDKVFLNKMGKVRFFMHSGTPIFVGIINGVSRNTLNPLIKSADPSLDYSNKEMSCVDYFWISSKQQIEGQILPISMFASAVMSKINVNNL